MSLAPGAGLLAGVGPGLGAHLARLLAAEGRDLVLLGRHDDVLSSLVDELDVEAVTRLVDRRAAVDQPDDTWRSEVRLEAEAFAVGKD